MPNTRLTAEIDISNIDEATEKVNRLLELLKEATSIISSLSEGIKN